MEKTLRVKMNLEHIKNRVQLSKGHKHFKQLIFYNFIITNSKCWTIHFFIIY